MGLRFVLFAILICMLTQLGMAREMVCKAGDDTCDSKSASKQSVCGSLSRCVSEKPFYHRGGSAQAYTPNAPVKSQVCDTDENRQRYKPAFWPFGRSSKGKAPHLKVNLNILQCEESNSKQCCCSEYNTDDSGITIEVWQAQPNGRYASLTLNRDDGVCRATLPGTSFTTLAPGSTGIFGGIGPYGWDSFPYGAPVVHMLFSSDQHQPLLVHLPIVLDRKLESRNFHGPDWRGPAYVTSKVRDKPFEITSWSVSDESVTMDVTIFMQPTQNSIDLRSTLCPSSFYGSPSSFFLEPIAVCAPSMLDFFAM